ncbi:HNH/ENDO VII family nuclease [Priestia flexa]|nr:HNH/ENDO VII family nuclease [Priestia flexa]
MPELAPAGPALAQQTVRETLQNVKYQAMQMITPIYNPKVKRYQDPGTGRFVGNPNVERVEKPVGVEKKGKEVERVRNVESVQGVSRGTGEVAGLKSRKLSSEQIELDWLPDKYTAVEVKGTVKVGGKEVDVSRRVYQIEIDKNYVPNDPKALGKSNGELMEKGKSPYIVKDGVESKVELHHLIQKEPGGMVEIAELTHDKYDSTLHGLVENGKSFRINPELEKMYNNFRSNYWKMRASE